MEMKTVRRYSFAEEYGMLRFRIAIMLGDLVAEGNTPIAILTHL